MAKPIKVRAIRINQPVQGGTDLFVASVKVRDLIDSSQFDIDYWEAEKKDDDGQGYQRREGESRTRKIARFVSSRKDALLPTTILVSARHRHGEDALTFHEEDGGAGVLHIKHYPLWVVDGQHRIAGLRYAIEELKEEAWLDHELPVVFLSNFQPVEEVRQFFFLNTYQKKVSTDLAERLLSDLAKNSPEERQRQKDDGLDWGNRALKVIDLLNERADSPWYKKIRLPNSPKLPTNIVNQVSLKKSMQPIFRGVLSDIKDADKSYEILRNYWQALANVFPAAFAEPSDYVIQKTPGIFSLHQLGHKIFTRLGSNETSEHAYQAILQKIFPKAGEVDSDWWMNDNNDGAGLYGSMKGFAIMAEKFEELMDENL